MTKVANKLVPAICWFCGGKFVQRNTRARFCCVKHKVYYHRQMAKAARESAIKPAAEVSLAARILGRVGPRPGKM